MLLSVLAMSPKVTRAGFYTKGGREQKRYIIVGLLVFVWVSIIVLRLFYLQIVEHRYYIALAKKQQGFSRILEPKRGDIYFRTKDGELQRAATTKIGARLYIDARHVKNPEETFKKLSLVTDLDQDQFRRIVSNVQDPYEVLKRRIDLGEAERILDLNLPGVGLEEERWRFYLNNDFGSHILGFVSSLDASQGQYGVEKYFDNALQGKSGKISGDKDAGGLLVPLFGPQEVEAEAGQDLVLTIEPRIESEVKSKLKALQEKWSPLSGGILVLEPKTGKILALSAIPSFDPNLYQKEKDLGVFLNPFVEKIFELGSVFKPLTLAAALDQGAIRPETTYVDMGEIRIGDRVIKNFDGKARGLRNMAQILEESLNTGAVFVMQQMGGENLKNYFYKFGLGEATGIELPGEVAGNLSNLDTGREVEYATASFGQGVAVTPLELAMALSSLANGGHLMKPIIRADDVPQVVRDTVSLQTSETISRMLVDVVDKALAGGKVKMDRYSIAAKTGTAQIPASRRGGGKGYSDEFLHAFFGYFPAYDPKFFIFMFLERPQGVKYASQSLSDTFRDLIEFLINYYTIPPDR